MTNLSIFNGFGITPTASYTAAGLDFYIPLIETAEQASEALKAFEKSYNVNEEKVNTDWASIIDWLSEINRQFQDTDIINILNLYYAFDSNNKRIAEDPLDYFLTSVLINKHGKWGLTLRPSDTICINSGIKVALDKDTAGIFFNKSGRGNQGFDVRAQVVDEDYSGYVHLSVAYTKNNITSIFCGDKLTQMVILPIIHKQPVEVDIDTYNKLLEGSARGSDWNGSTN